MIYLLLSILCGSMVSLVMRISEGRIQSKTGMVAMNYLTCLTVNGLDFIDFPIENGQQKIDHFFFPPCFV